MVIYIMRYDVRKNTNIKIKHVAYSKIRAELMYKYDLRTWYINRMRALYCQHCGCTDWRLLVWHHIDRNNKLKEVSKLVALQYDKQIIEAEMQKCIVLCHNCHFLVHRGNKEYSLEQELNSKIYKTKPTRVRIKSASLASRSTISNKNVGVPKWAMDLIQEKEV